MNDPSSPESPPEAGWRAALVEGERLQRSGRLAEAEAIYRRVLAESPGHPDALGLLASIAQAVGRHADAVRLLEQACVARPLDPNLLIRLGFSLEAQERWEEALEAYERAAEAGSRFPEVYNNLGNVLHVQGRIDAAIEAYRRALALRPDYADAQVHLGHVLKMAGDLAGAERAYRRVLSLAPERLETYRLLVYVRRYGRADDPDIAAMRAHLSRPGLSPVDAMHLHFALGKALHDLGCSEEAFGHWRRANGLIRASYAYDISEEVGLVERIRSVFGPGFANSRAPAGRADVRPIFIVGLPRSGSTLVEQILASHPDVAGAGEVIELRRAIEGAGRFPAEGGYDAGAIRGMADEYLQRMRFYNYEGRPRQSDKALFNFLYIGMIRLLFPNAAVIACWRNPLDTCLSCYRHYFPEIRRFVYDLEELGRFYGLFAELMAHWRETLPGFVHELRHEDLVEDPAGEIRRLLDFCGLDWNEGCLRFHESRRAAKTTSATQIRQPINRSGMGQWRRYAAHLGPLVKGLAERVESLPACYREAVDIDTNGRCPLP